MNTLLKIIVASFLFLGVIFFIRDPSSRDPTFNLPRIPIQLPPSFPMRKHGDLVKVVRVIDGDTIEIEGGQKVRYIGINTPEIYDPRRPVECFGKEAAIKNKELAEGKEVRLKKDVSETDKYGRLLRYVYIGDLFINEYLVRQGYAFATSYPPDVQYQQQFLQAEHEARDYNRGLWSICPHH